MGQIKYPFKVSCKMATELIEKRTVVALSLKERIQRWVHLSICDGCTSYKRQSQFLDSFFLHRQQAPSFPKSNQIPHLSATSKKDIQDKLDAMGTIEG